MGAGGGIGPDTHHGRAYLQRVVVEVEFLQGDEARDRRRHVSQFVLGRIERPQLRQPGNALPSHKNRDGQADEGERG